MYAQIGDEFSEVRFEAGSDIAVLTQIYDAVCEGVSRCSAADEDEDSSPIGGMLGFPNGKPDLHNDNLTDSQDGNEPNAAVASSLARLFDLLPDDPSIEEPDTVDDGTGETAGDIR